MTRIKRPLFALVIPLGVAVSTAGCMTATGAWSEQGFAETTFGWRASYAPGTTALLGPDWRLDNWVVDDYGALVPKRRGAYVASDEDEEATEGPGSRSERHRIFVYDLKYLNVRNNGVIWAQTRRMHRRDTDRDLDVLLANYVDSLAGTGLYEQGTVFGGQTIKIRSFTAFVTDRQPVKLGPYPAISAVIELAETEKLRLDPNARMSKIAVAITKFQYLEKVEVPGAMGAEERPATFENPQAPRPTTVIVDGQVYYKRPAVMIVGYYNDVDHFAASLPDFTTLRDRIQWSNPVPPEPPPPPPQPTAPPSPPAPPATTPPSDVPAPLPPAPPP